MVIQILKSVISMIELTKEESYSCKGGAATVSASLVNAVTNIIKSIYVIGQNLGGMIRRWVTGTSC